MVVPSAMSAPTLRGMTVKRMDHVGVVVEDLAAAIAFFIELGLELEGETTVEGEFVDQLVTRAQRSAETPGHACATPTPVVHPGFWVKRTGDTGLAAVTARIAAIRRCTATRV